MYSPERNTQLGSKWFTFFTKIRPVFVTLSLFTVLTDFAMNPDIYSSILWLQVYLAAIVAQTVLNIMILIKSNNNYPKLVRFINSVLIFEIFSMSYQTAVKQYMQSDYDVVYALCSFAVVLVIFYFLWYRLNMKYFKKRMVSLVENSSETIYGANTAEPPKILFCRKCGERLPDNSIFCNKCGTKISEE